MDDKFEDDSPPPEVEDENVENEFTKIKKSDKIVSKIPSKINGTKNIMTKLKSKKEYSENDFDVLSLCGRGAYGSVLKVAFKKDKSKYYAVKVTDIESMRKINKLYQIYLENDILNTLNNPYVVQIFGTFQNSSKIYMILEYLAKGDFSDLLRMNHPLKDDTIRFYAAELLTALEYLKNNNVVHRDLKPENIMLDDNYHLKLIDFATAKIIGKYFDKEKMLFVDDNGTYKMDQSEANELKGVKQQIDIEEEEDFEFRDKRGTTFVGTAEYVSPEVLKEVPADLSADIWAFGIILYQMYCGKTPFKDKTNYLIFRNIENVKISYPENMPESARDLISRILVIDPQKRLGAGKNGTANDFKHLKEHPFFSNVKFGELLKNTPPHSQSFYSQRKKKNKNDEEENNKMQSVNKKENFKVLKEGIINKKSPWFHYNTRYIILDSAPKITYKDPETQLVKGQIFLSKECKAVHLDDLRYFDLITPKRNFRFKSDTNDGLVWEKSINDAIKKYGK